VHHSYLSKALGNGCLLLLSLLLPQMAWAKSTLEGSRPNLVFILADDLGYGDLGCYGQKSIQTPRLDRMAAEGLRFTQAYAGATVCAPSRCVLMTGLHTGHGRVRGNGGATPLAQVLRPEDFTVARVLKEAGYDTALIGKWGLGDIGKGEVGLPTRQGFGYFYGYLNQSHAHNYYPTYLWRNVDKVPLPNVVTNESPTGAGVATVKAVYSAQLIEEEALEYLRRPKDRPFFLYYAPTLPHANNEAGRKGMEIPDYGPYASQPWTDPQKGHAAMVSYLDRSVGRILDLLKELGLDRNTLVIFSSDNGPHREGGYDPDFYHSSGMLRGIKRDLYDGGIRVPFLVRWPGTIPAGRLCQEVVWFPDFLPTAADLAGAKLPKPLDGLSMVSLLQKPGARIRRNSPLYWEFFEGGFKQALRWDNWKLVRLAKGKTTELYDLQQDPGERENLALTHPSRVRRLTTMLEGCRVDTPDWPVPLSTH
jgi:arylsulfatase A-like enzyme